MKHYLIGSFNTITTSDVYTDSGFDIGTGTEGSFQSVDTISIQSDGKIIIGGGFTTYNGTTRLRIARLHTNGSLDTSFVSGATGSVYAISIQSDGKIIIGGSFLSYPSGTTRNRIARIHTNGSLDASFDVGTGANNTLYTTSIQSDDGNIIIGGSFTSYNGTTSNYIARLHTNGDLDTSFVVGTGASASVLTTAIQSDGKIIIGGDFTTYNGTTRNRIVRLHTNGSIDTSFVIGTGASLRVSTISIQSDGKIIIGGNFSSYNGTTVNRIARLHTNGSLDTSFGTTTGANSDVYTTAIQSDGKIIIGGDFTTYNGTTRNYIARLHTNGSLDTNFVVGAGANNVIYTTAIHSDGKIIIGGAFTEYNTLLRNRILRIVGDSQDNAINIARLTEVTSGGDVVGFELDSSFVTGTGFNGETFAIDVQSDGKVVVGGDFTDYNGTSRQRIARLHVNGSVDTAFDAGSTFDDAIKYIEILGDGRVFVGGDFTGHSVILSTDGSFDSQPLTLDGPILDSIEVVP